MSKLPKLEAAELCNARIKTESGHAYCTNIAGDKTTHRLQGRCWLHGGASNGAPRLTAKEKQKSKNRKSRQLIKLAKDTYYNKPNGRYRHLKKSASDRKLDFTIEFGEFMIFWNAPCFYCGKDVEGVRLDRMNNDIGYLLHNVVQCCWDCNRSKWTRTAEEFVDHCKTVALHIGHRLKALERPNN